MKNGKAKTATSAWQLTNLTALGLSLLLVTWFTAEAKSEDRFLRWALMPSPNCPKELSDLVFSELSTQNLELVERGKLLEAMAAEQQLSARSTAEERTVNVGKLVKADAMILIDFHKNEKGLTLTEVTCLATQLGVRVGSASYTNGIENASKGIARFASEMHQRFADGIESVVAVSPFISQNVSYEFDGLQTAIAELLTQKLMKTPGVAVVEIEQATKLLEELALSGTQEQNHSILKVRGSFKVDPLEPTKISVETEISGQQLQTIKTINLQRSDLSKWVSEELLPAVLVAAVGNSSHQVQLGSKTADFFEQAAEFANQGDLLRATQLREAGLVADFANASQRKILAREYWRLLHSHAVYPRSRPTRNGFCDRDLIEMLRDKVRPSLVQAERFGSRYLHHIEWLIRTGNLKDYLEFRQLVRHCTINQYFHTDPFIERLSVVSQLIGERLQSIATTPINTSELNQLKHQRLVDSEDWWLQAPRQLNSEFWKSQNESCLHALATIIEHYPANRSPSKGLLICFPDRWMYSSDGLREKARANSYAVSMQVMREREIERVRSQIDLKMVERYQRLLARQPSDLAQVCALHCQLELLVFKLWSNKTESQLVSTWTQQLSSVIAKLLKYAKELKQASKTNRNLATSSYSHAFWSQLDATLKNAGSYVALPIDYRPFAEQVTRHSPPSAEPTEGTWGRLVLKELDISLDERTATNSRNNYYAPGIINSVSCESFDVFWGDRSVYVMKQPGVLERLPIEDWYSKPQTIASVHWDGRFVWFSGATKRLLLLDSQTWQLNEIENLPARDHLYACPMREGKAVLIANVMPGYRTWCATVSMNPSLLRKGGFGYRTKIIHEAKKVRQLGSRLPDNDSILQYGFRADWAHAWKKYPDQLTVLTQHSGRLLSIEADEKLTLHPVQVSGVYDQANVIATSENHVYLLHGKKLAALDNKMRRIGEVDLGKYFRQVLLHEGWLYVFGGDSSWVRVRQDLQKVETLVAGKLPAGFHSCKLGISSHFGLVAFGNSLNNDRVPKLYQVHLQSEPNDTGF